MTGFFVIAGFQKCASTWLQRCLQAHPQVFMPDRHMLHYFDINYHRGTSWYEEFYRDAAEHQVRGDGTVTYARSQDAMSRIKDYDPAAKVVLLLRNPIERAWSHYWHERKKGKITFAFDEWRSNYDLFSDWLLPGMYDRHLTQCDKLFDAGQLLVLFHDDIRTSPQQVVSATFEHIGVSSEFQPQCLHRTVNRTAVDRAAGRLPLLRRLFSGRSEQQNHQSGPDPETCKNLAEVFAPTIRYLEDRFQRDLSSWLRGINA